MGDVTKAIKDYIAQEIKLNGSDISQSAKSREWLLSRIASEIGKLNKAPVLYSQEPFVYFGSYFKGTKVKVVDEYDVLVVIDSSSGMFSQHGVQIGNGEGSASPNYKYDQSFLKSDGSGVSPAILLNWLKGIVEKITDSFGGEAPERNGQAVTATIKSSNIKIDLVPAGIFRRNSDGTIFYNIPRGDKNSGWIVTSPRADIDLLNERAERRNDFKNVIRITKRIRDKYNFLVPSFAIETAILSYAYYNDWYQDLYTDLRGALIHIANAFRSGNLADPYDTSNNLISDVDSLSWYAERIDKIVAELDECSKIDDQEKARARVWKAFENE